jgi:hypothetical protein
MAVTGNAGAHDNHNSDSFAHSASQRYSDLFNHLRSWLCSWLCCAAGRDEDTNNLNFVMTDGRAGKGWEFESVIRLAPGLSTSNFEHANPLEKRREIQHLSKNACIDGRSRPIERLVCRGNWRLHRLSQNLVSRTRRTAPQWLASSSHRRPVAKT